jgi:hypothetical protein
MGLLNGAVVAAEIKRVKPQLPIVMPGDHLDLPAGAMPSVDAVVIKSDGIHFLGAIIHFVRNVPAKRIAQAAQQLVQTAPPATHRLQSRGQFYGGEQATVTRRFRRPCAEEASWPGVSSSNHPYTVSKSLRLCIPCRRWRPARRRAVRPIN